MKKWLYCIGLNRYSWILANMGTAMIVLFLFFSGSVWGADGSKEGAPLSVKDSVISTLETNPRLGELKQNREIASRDLRQSKGRYYPRVDAVVGYGTDRHSDASTRSLGTDDTFDERTEASIVLVQPLYQGGEIDGSVAAQTARLDSAEKRVMDNAEALALDAVIAHLEVWRQRQLLDLTNRNVSAHRKILTHITERQQAGASSTADVMQANGRLALTLSSRYQIDAEVAAARANYLRIVGHLPGPVALPKEFRAFLPDTEAAIIERVERCNPKLLAYGADIRVAEQEVNVSRSSFLPKVNLEVGTTYDNQVEGAQSYSHNTAAMVRARWNLYNGGSDVAARDAALSRKLQVAEARKHQHDLIVEQVQDTRSRYQTAGERIRAYSDALEYNRQTADAYQQQFIVGQRTLLDVLDAENELFQTSGHLITSSVNEMIAAYRLLALMGCLLRSLDIDPEAYGIINAPSDCCGPVSVSDSDGDGVSDGYDRCPDTPLGTEVDGKGCPIPKATKSALVTSAGTWLYKDIQFETNRWTLKASSNQVLDEIADNLNANANLRVEVQGHSDSSGKRDYNISLSLKRAQTVQSYLIQKGVPIQRITAKGFGPDRPIDTNATAAGRANNRRVELKPLQ